MNFTFTFTASLTKTDVLVSRCHRTMQRWKILVENALCWTFAAPLIRAKRQRTMQEVAAEWHDRRRIDRLLNDLVSTYGDLLR